MIMRIVPSLLNSFPGLMVKSSSCTNKIPEKFTISFTTNVCRSLHSSPALRCSDEEEDTSTSTKKEIVDVLDGKRLVVRNRVPKYYTWDIGIKYIQSEAYRETYGTEPVWVKYKRNFKGQFAPSPRKSCIKNGVISSGSPCPICRDDYLVVDYRNTELLKQFLSPHTAKMIAPKKTGLCQKAYDFLDIAIDQAKEAGLIIHDVPIREYNYKDYYSTPQSN